MGAKLKAQSSKLKGSSKFRRQIPAVRLQVVCLELFHSSFF
jgi:hypothetical protein